MWLAGPTMTITAEPSQAAPSVLPALAGADDAVEVLRGQCWESAPTADLGQATAGLAQLEAKVSSLRLEVLAEADRPRVADETADTGTDAWASTADGRHARGDAWRV